MIGTTIAATTGALDTPRPRPPSARVALVGAGPGSADLLTVKAARLIAEADWLVHDALVHDEVLALATRARRIAVGKRAGQPSTPQAQINRILVDCARRGGLVVRLKGGDPLLFARAEEELDALADAGIAVDVVPGITTAQAAHAALGVPMTRRGRRRALVLATPQTERPRDARGVARPADANASPTPTPSSADLQWARAIVNAGGGAIYMAASASARIRAALLALGLPADTPATWMVDVSRPEAGTLCMTLGALEPPPPPYAGRPALLLVGVAPRPAPQAIRNRIETSQATAGTTAVILAP